ncbi:hypothetical protein [Streptomyces cinnamoneus]|uniref:hypothetical protein n=1 Tax=Streptomyces cinnamoneus TaxID=53446 RepID=UPI0018659F60|nr:hypothetical protein [Streptomyces cinnamoneus]
MRRTPRRPNDALRAKVADVNERSRQGRGEVRPRCATCDDIKHRRYRAVDDGDTEEATRMTVAMGVHLREAHPE